LARVFAKTLFYEAGFYEAGFYEAAFYEAGLLLCPRRLDSRWCHKRLRQHRQPVFLSSNQLVAVEPRVETPYGRHARSICYTVQRRGLTRETGYAATKEIGS
jgi:hypothetical protein